MKKRRLPHALGEITAVPMPDLTAGTGGPERGTNLRLFSGGGRKNGSGQKPPQSRKLWGLLGQTTFPGAPPLSGAGPNGHFPVRESRERVQSAIGYMIKAFHLLTKGGGGTDRSAENLEITSGGEFYGLAGRGPTRKRGAQGGKWWRLWGIGGTYSGSRRKEGPVVRWLETQEGGAWRLGGTGPADFPWSSGESFFLDWRATRHRASTRG